MNNLNLCELVNNFFPSEKCEIFWQVKIVHLKKKSDLYFFRAHSDCLPDIFCFIQYESLIQFCRVRFARQCLLNKNRFKISEEYHPFNAFIWLKNFLVVTTLFNFKFSLIVCHTCLIFCLLFTRKIDFKHIPT